jgi:hypothetical protein
MSFLGFLAEAQTDQTFWNIEDEAFLEVMRMHRDNLARCRQPVG